MKHDLIILLVILGIASAAQDVYWRPYLNGEIPSDAVIATFDGRDATYIGNVPIHGGGLYVGQIWPGDKTIIVSGQTDRIDGPIFRETENIQILCSGQKNSFEWVTANSTSLSRVRNLVKGGYEGSPTYGLLYIGRAVHGGLKIGKVIGYKPNQADLFIADGFGEVQYFRYEVLTYTGTDT